MKTPRSESYGQIIARRFKTNVLATSEDPFSGIITIVLEAGAKIKLEPPYDMELFADPLPPTPVPQTVESGENVSTEITPHGKVKEPSVDEKVIKVKKKKTKK